MEKNLETIVFYATVTAAVATAVATTIAAIQAAKEGVIICANF